MGKLRSCSNAENTWERKPGRVPGENSAFKRSVVEGDMRNGLDSRDLKMFRVWEMQGLRQSFERRKDMWCPQERMERRLNSLCGLASVGSKRDTLQ